VASKGDEGRDEKLGELGRLPGGHHGLTPEQIAVSQRERLLAAIAAEVAEVGYRDVKIRAFTKRAGVSTRDFYDLFDGKEETFLAAFDAVRDYLEGRLAAAAAEETEWARQVVAVLRAGLEFFAEEPELARLCLLEPVSATSAIATHFRKVVLACIPALVKGRELLDDPGSLPPNTEDSVLGGILSLASRKVVTGDTELLLELLPDLVEFALNPYLGADRAVAMAAEAAAE
jgi:AcrR family transcriptional regulator